MSKFLFLHSDNNPESDFNVLDVLGTVLFFRDTCLGQSFNDIFTKYDVVVMDVDKPEYRQWYSCYRNAISASSNIKCIFLHQPHVHIKEDLMKLLKEEWRVNNVIKELPKIWNSKEDLINKLINTNHLASLDMPATESCFKSLLHALFQKLGL